MMSIAPAVNPTVITLPYRPRFPQTVIHPQLDSHRFNVLVAHRRMGKTLLLLNQTIKRAAKCALERPQYAFISPFLKQAKRNAWEYLKKFTAPIPGRGVNESDLFVELPNKARVFLMGADNPDAMRGMYLDGAVLDEYGQMKQGVFQEIVRPALTDRKGWGVFSGTPKGQGAFSDVYQQAVRAMAKNDPNWWAGLYRADETNVIDAEELALLRATLSDNTYRQEFLCDFTAAADNVLITIDLVSDAMNTTRTEAEIKNAPRILALDPARFGDDRSVIIRRQGLNVFPPKIFRKADNMAMVGHLMQEAKEFNPDAVFVDAGAGAGIIDRCRQLGMTVIEVNFGGSPLKPGQYANKRAEMWDLVREYLESGGALPNDPELKADLVVPTYDYDASNQMRLESKENIKKRLGKSPDLGDALALTFAFPVQSRGMGVLRGGRGMGKTNLSFANEGLEYDPLG